MKAMFPPPIITTAVNLVFCRIVEQCDNVGEVEGVVEVVVLSPPHRVQSKHQMQPSVLGECT